MPAVWWQFRKAVEKAGRSSTSAASSRPGCVRGLADADRAAYDAPFPDETFKAGPRAMPLLVPTRPDDPENGPNRAAWEALRALREAVPRRVLRLRPDHRRRWARSCGADVPGAAGREHPTIADAGHFLQEDAGAELGRVVARVHRGPLPADRAV